MRAMKRRHFLALLSTASATTAVGAAFAGRLLPAGATLAPRFLEGGSLALSHRRQVFGAPVTVRLELPAARRYAGMPEPVALREEAPEWWVPVGGPDNPPVRDGLRWEWTWAAPIVRPTDDELQTELVRYRVALFSAQGQTSVVSEPLEIVCGWGA